MPFISSVRKQFGPQGKKNTPWRKYAFGSHTFTNAGATGIYGPSLSQIQSAYSSQPWASDTSNLNMTVNGRQRWTVPSKGYYRILAVGASAGTNARSGGRGIQVRADVFLNVNEIINISVGQGGWNNSGCGDCNTGAGGGTFVVRDNGNQPLVIAGGGGGNSGSRAGLDAVSTRNGGTSTSGYAGGSNGSGGSCGQGTSGAGFTGNGCQSGWNSGELGGDNNGRAQSWTNGGAGGSSTQANPPILGGFGGGGSGHGNCYIGGPGGGGYSGGGAAEGDYGGGGGGSYVIDGALNVTYPGYNTTNSCGSGWAPHGYVTITRL